MTSRTLVLGILLSGCGGAVTPVEGPPAASAAPPASSPVEPSTRVADARRAPAEAARPTAEQDSPPATASPPAAPVPEEPAGVVARSIGMHIGGGPNDAATKAPFTRTIEGGFDAILACTKRVPAERRKGTFGIDLLVPRDGGKAGVSNPRTGIPGDEFRACVVAVFESLVFEKPRRGATKLSYSLRFE